MLNFRDMESKYFPKLKLELLQAEHKLYRLLQISLKSLKVSFFLIVIWHFSPLTWLVASSFFTFQFSSKTSQLWQFGLKLVKVCILCFFNVHFSCWHLALIASYTQVHYIKYVGFFWRPKAFVTLHLVSTYLCNLARICDKLICKSLSHWMILEHPIQSVQEYFYIDRSFELMGAIFAENNVHVVWLERLAKLQRIEVTRCFSVLSLARLLLVTADTGPPCPLGHGRSWLDIRCQCWCQDRFRKLVNPPQSLSATGRIPWSDPSRAPGLLSLGGSWPREAVWPDVFGSRGTHSSGRGRIKAFHGFYPSAFELLRMTTNLRKREMTFTKFEKLVNLN